MSKLRRGVPYVPTSQWDKYLTDFVGKEVEVIMIAGTAGPKMKAVLAKDNTYATSFIAEVISIENLTTGAILDTVRLGEASNLNDVIDSNSIRVDVGSLIKFSNSAPNSNGNYGELFVAGSNLSYAMYFGESDEWYCDDFDCKLRLKILRYDLWN
jgi:hypothetical protein